MNPEYVPEWEQIWGFPSTIFSPFRRIVRLITPAGDWVVKPVRDPVQLRWWMSVDRELRFRGFRSMPPIYTDGSRWLIAINQPGGLRTGNPVPRRPRYRPVHRLGRGLATPPFHRKRHPFLHRLDARLSEFPPAENLRGDGRGDRRIDPAIRPAVLPLRYGGAEANRRISPFPFCSKGSGAGGLSFIRIWPVTIGSWTEGKARLIDFETADYDWQLGDLWQLLSRVLPEQNWNSSVWHEVIAVYGEILSLSFMELSILRKLLGFPNEFFRESLGWSREEGATLPR